MEFLNRIKRILLLARCIVRSLFYGSANKTPENVSNIMVVPTGKLGDIVCNTPVLYAIRKHLPSARIIVAQTGRLPDKVLAGSSLIDGYIDLNKKGVIREIKECKADAALITGPSFVPTALMYLSGIQLVVAPEVIGGFSPFETRLYKILKKFIKTFEYKMGEYAPRQRLKCLEPLGVVTEDTKKHLGFSKNADTNAEEVLNKNKKLVGITLTAGNKIKDWPAERFAKVANYIGEKYEAMIGIILGKNDKNNSGRFN